MHFPASPPPFAKVVKQHGTHVILAHSPCSFVPSALFSFFLSGCCADVNCSIYLHFQFTAPILLLFLSFPFQSVFGLMFDVLQGEDGGCSRSKPIHMDDKISSFWQVLLSNLASQITRIGMTVLGDDSLQ